MERGLIEINLSKSLPPNRSSLEKIIAIMMKVVILIMHSLIKLMMRRRGCQMMHKISRIPILRILVSQRGPRNQLGVVNLGSRMMARKVGRRAKHRESLPKLRLVRGVLGGLKNRRASKSRWTKGRSLRKLRRRQEIQGSLMQLTQTSQGKISRQMMEPQEILKVGFKKEESLMMITQINQGKISRLMMEPKEILKVGFKKAESLMILTQINQEKMSRQMMEPQENLKVGCKKVESHMLLTKIKQGKMPRLMMEPQEILKVGCKKAESLIIGQAIRDLQGRGLLKIETQQEVDLNNRGIKMERGWIQTLPERDLIPTQITQLHLLPLQLLMPSGLQARWSKVLSTTPITSSQMSNRMQRTSLHFRGMRVRSCR